MTAMTAAQKQAAYRARTFLAKLERQKVTPDGNGNAPDVTVTRSPDVTMNHTVEQCKRRAAAGKPWRPGDPVWPYTRHLTPIAFVAWCRLNKPSWLTSAKPGDEDYNWDESAVPLNHPARLDAIAGG